MILKIMYKQLHPVLKHAQYALRHRPTSEANFSSAELVECI